MSNYIDIIRNKETGEERKIRDTTIVANGENIVASDELDTLKVGGVTYKLKDSSIVANSGSEATEILEKLTIGNKTYSIPANTSNESGSNPLFEMILTAGFNGKMGATEKFFFGFPIINKTINVTINWYYILQLLNSYSGNSVEYYSGNESANYLGYTSIYHGMLGDFRSHSNFAANTYEQIPLFLAVYEGNILRIICATGQDDYGDGEQVILGEIQLPTTLTATSGRISWSNLKTALSSVTNIENKISNIEINFIEDLSLGNIDFFNSGFFFATANLSTYEEDALTNYSKIIEFEYVEE